MSRSMAAKADTSYLYTDRDIATVVKVRNEKDGKGYLDLTTVPLPNNPADNVDENGMPIDGSGVVLLQDAAGGLVQDNIAVNVNGGAVATIGSITYRATGAQEARGRAIMFQNALTAFRKIEANGSRPYPAKILFSINPGGGHWIAGEIIVTKTGDNYTASAAQYDPMSTSSSQISQTVLDEFSGAFNIVFEKQLPQAVTFNQCDIGVNVGGNNLPIQADGTSCGVFTAFALAKLQTGQAAGMWSDFPDQRVGGAPKQRAVDVALVQSIATNNLTTAAVRAKFGQDRFVRASARDLKLQNTAVEEQDAKELVDMLYQTFNGGGPRAFEVFHEKIAEIDNRYRADKKAWERIFVLPVQSTIADARAIGSVNLMKHLENFCTLHNAEPDKQEEAINFFVEKFVQNVDSTSRGAILNSLTNGVTNAVTDVKIINKINKLSQEIQVNSAAVVAKLSAIPKTTAADKDSITKRYDELYRIVIDNSQDKEILQKVLTNIAAKAKEYSDIEAKLYCGIARMLIADGIKITEEMFKAVKDAANSDLKTLLQNEYLIAELGKINKDKFAELTGSLSDAEKESLATYCSVLNQSTILHSAAENSDAGVTEEVLKMPNIASSINAFDKNGDNPLMIAIIRNNLNFIEPLCSKGASVTMSNAYGYSALSLAQEMHETDSQYIEICEEIIKHNKLLPPAIAADDALYNKANNIKSERDKKYASIKLTYQAVEKNSKLIIDHSDFFTLKEIKKELEDGGELKRVLITQKDLSFVTCSDDERYKMETPLGITMGSNAKETYVKLEGKFKDIFQPKTKNPSKAFQPYHCRFGRMHFKEGSDGKKIFGEAALFMANFSNCVFENVDFSGIPSEIRSTIKFHNCQFIDCIPNEIKNRNQVSKNTGMADEIADIRAKHDVVVWEEVKEARQELQNEKQNAEARGESSEAIRIKDDKELLKALVEETKKVVYPKGSGVDAVIKRLPGASVIEPTATAAIVQAANTTKSAL